MEYERLTKRDKYGTPCLMGGCEHVEKCKGLCLDHECPVAIAIMRLAELEDKIEQGMLVDTESYFIVEENQWAGKNRFLVCQNAVQLAVCDFCESREEAEKKIKELQE